VMTVKLVVLYTQPDDAAAFDAHYLGVHGPLVDKLPGLVRWESAQLVAAADGGELTYHRQAELYFADQTALEAALGSDAGAATVSDYGQIAPPGSRIFIAAVDE
ncbi:MAG TPA: EthD family reductase, partial [Mycobacteriales bacterium]|nr:EthD family reductase [Mycobacteriales bacterium]